MVPRELWIVLHVSRGRRGAVLWRLGRVLGRLGVNLGTLCESWSVSGASWCALVASWGSSWDVFRSQKDTSRLGHDFPIDVCSIFVPTSTPENKKNFDFSLVLKAFLRKLPLEVNIEF